MWLMRLRCLRRSLGVQIVMMGGGTKIRAAQSDMRTSGGHMRTHKYLLPVGLPMALGLVLALSPWLSHSKAQPPNNALPTSLAPNTADLLRRSLKNGTPQEKWNALNIIRDLKPIQLIPEVIEAIGDPTPLPREGDTGWGFVGHQAASAMGEIARAIDGVEVETRGQGYHAYSFHGDMYKGGQKLKELGRLSEVGSNWAKWWDSRWSKPRWSKPAK